MNNITLDNETLSRIASKVEKDLGGNLRLEPNTEEQFLEYKERGLQAWKKEQIPHHPFTIEIQGMRKSVIMNGKHKPENYKKVMGRIWSKIYTMYPAEPREHEILPEVAEGEERPVYYSHQLQINNHSDGTSEVKLMVLPLEFKDRKDHETRVSLGYRDFDSIDREFDIIQNCESFKFSPDEIAGLSIDQSRNEEEDYMTSTLEEEDLMTNLDIKIIPEESDGFLRQMVELRDDLRANMKSLAPTWA